MPTLREQLGSDPRRSQVMDDAERVLDAEVAEKTGLTGMAVKGAFKVVKGIKPGFIREVIDNLFDDFVDALQPLVDEAADKGVRPGDHVQANPERVAGALLAVTDARATNAKRAAIKKTYDKLRPTAQKHVEAAAPRLGQMLDRHIS